MTAQAQPIFITGVPRTGVGATALLLSKLGVRFKFSGENEPRRPHPAIRARLQSLMHKLEMNPDLDREEARNRFASALQLPPLWGFMDHTLLDWWEGPCSLFPRASWVVTTRSAAPTMEACQSTYWMRLPPEFISWKEWHAFKAQQRSQLIEGVQRVLIVCPAKLINGDQRELERLVRFLELPHPISHFKD